MKRFVLLTVVLSFLLCGCGVYLSESELESAKNYAFERGFDEGFNAGYSQGAEDQMEFISEDLLIDGRSIRDIEKEVRNEFGITPHEAFTIYDEYNYDWTHGGYTWKEYQIALEAMYYTCEIFPFDY